MTITGFWDFAQSTLGVDDGYGRKRGFRFLYNIWSDVLRILDEKTSKLSDLKLGPFEP